MFYKMWQKYKTFLMDLIQSDVGLLVLMAFFLGLTAALIDIVVREAFPAYRILINFIELMMFGVLMFGLVIPMITASRELNRIHAYHKLLVDALETIAKIKEGVEPGQVYKLSEIYSLDNPNTWQAQKLLQAVLGEDFQIISNLNQHETFHELKLMKHGELVPPQELS